MPRAAHVYHVNPLCQQWEEQNHRKHMERRIREAKSTISAVRGGSATTRVPSASGGTNTPSKHTAGALIPEHQQRVGGVPVSTPSHTHDRQQDVPVTIMYPDLPPGIDVQRLDDLIAQRLQQVLGEPLIQRIQQQLVQQRQQLNQVQQLNQQQVQQHQQHQQHSKQPQLQRQGSSTCHQGSAYHPGPSKRNSTRPGPRNGRPGTVDAAKPPRPRPAWNEEWAAPGPAQPLCAGAFPLPRSTSARGTRAASPSPSKNAYPNPYTGQPSTRATSADGQPRSTANHGYKDGVRVLLMPGALVSHGQGMVCSPGAAPPSSSSSSRPVSSTRYLSSNPLTESHMATIAALNPSAPAAAATTAPPANTIDAIATISGSIPAAHLTKPGSIRTLPPSPSIKGPFRDPPSSHGLQGPSTPTNGPALHAPTVRPPSSHYTDMTSLSRMSSARQSAHPSPPSSAIPSVRAGQLTPGSCHSGPSSSEQVNDLSGQQGATAFTPASQRPSADGGQQHQYGDDKEGEAVCRTDHQHQQGDRNVNAETERRDEEEEYEEDFEAYDGSELGTLRRSEWQASLARAANEAYAGLWPSVQDVTGLHASVKELNALVQAKISTVLMRSSHASVTAAGARRAGHALHTVTASGGSVHIAGGLDEEVDVCVSDGRHHLSGTMSLVGGDVELGASSNLIGGDPLCESDLAYINALDQQHGCGIGGESWEEQAFQAANLPQWGGSQEGWYEVTAIEAGGATGTGHWGDRQAFTTIHTTQDNNTWDRTSGARSAALQRLKMHKQQQQQQQQPLPPPSHDLHQTCMAGSQLVAAGAQSLGGDTVLLGTLDSTQGVMPVPPPMIRQSSAVGEEGAAHVRLSTQRSTLAHVDLGPEDHVLATDDGGMDTIVNGMSLDDTKDIMEGAIGGGGGGGGGTTSVRLAGQVVALWDSLRQLHELMSGPRGQELSPRNPLQAGVGFTHPHGSPASTPKTCDGVTLTPRLSASSGRPLRPSSASVRGSTQTGGVLGRPPPSRLSQQGAGEEIQGAGEGTQCDGPTVDESAGECDVAQGYLFGLSQMNGVGNSQVMESRKQGQQEKGDGDDGGDGDGDDWGDDVPLPGMDEEGGEPEMASPRTVGAMGIGEEEEEGLVDGDKVWMTGLIATLSRSLGGEEMLQELMTAVRIPPLAE